MRLLRPLSVLSLLIIPLTACQSPASIPPTATPVVAATFTPVEPTPTLPPLAVRIGNGGVYQEDFDSELARFIQQNPSIPIEDAKKTVVDQLIAAELLAQGAVENGFILEPDQFNAKKADLINQSGGQDSFNNWMSTNLYTADQFDRSLLLSIQAAWMRDWITSQVPETAEQVHARQILVMDRAEADYIVGQVKSGVDFATLAEQYDPITRGDLGWFPRGFLTQVAVEEAAFALTPNEISAVIQTEIGFHILQVIEKDPAHPLSPDALLVIKHQAVRQWLEEREQSSSIEILVK